MNMTRFPTLVGILILILGVVVGIVIINNKQLFSLKASPSLAPHSVSISNVTNSSFTVTWITETPTLGVVQTYSNNSFFKENYYDNLETNSNLHMVDVDNLKPNTKYFLSILSGNTTFKNGSKDWEVTTSSKSKKMKLLSGSVVEPSGNPKESIVTTIIGNSVYTTKSAQNGSWFLEIPEDTKKGDIILTAKSNLEDFGEVTASLSKGKIIPPIILGETHNYTLPQSPILQVIPQSE